MESIEIEVMTQHYIGFLSVEPIDHKKSVFKVSVNNNIIGRVQHIRKHNDIIWYSHEITDKELVEQIGEWLNHHFFN